MTDGIERMQSQCELCGKAVDYSNGIYGLNKCSGYDIFVCDTCYASNHDGWGPFHQTIVISIMNKKGKALPQRNHKGWLPREF